jgi:hypothetical protein
MVIRSMNLLAFGCWKAVVAKLLGRCGMIRRSLDDSLPRENRQDGELAGFARRDALRLCRTGGFNFFNARVPEVPAYPNRANVCYRF